MTDELINCCHFEMTCDIPWDLSKVQISDVRSNTANEQLELRSLTAGVSQVYVQKASQNYTEQPLHEISEMLDDRAFTERMISNVNIIFVEHTLLSKAKTSDDGDEHRWIDAVRSKSRHSKITVKEVS